MFSFLFYLCSTCSYEVLTAVLTTFTLHLETPSGSPLNCFENQWCLISKWTSDVSRSHLSLKTEHIIHLSSPKEKAFIYRTVLHSTHEKFEMSKNTLSFFFLIYTWPINISSTFFFIITENAPFFFRTYSFIHLTHQICYFDLCISSWI